MLWNTPTVHLKQISRQFETIIMEEIGGRRSRDSQSILHGIFHEMHQAKLRAWPCHGDRMGKYQSGQEYTCSGVIAQHNIDIQKVEFSIPMVPSANQKVWVPYLSALVPVHRCSPVCDYCHPQKYWQPDARVGTKVHVLKCEDGLGSTGEHIWHSYSNNQIKYIFCCCNCLEKGFCIWVMHCSGRVEPVFQPLKKFVSDGK